MRVMAELVGGALIRLLSNCGSRLLLANHWLENKCPAERFSQFTLRLRGKPMVPLWLRLSKR